MSKIIYWNTDEVSSTVHFCDKSLSRVLLEASLWLNWHDDRLISLYSLTLTSSGWDFSVKYPTEELKNSKKDTITPYTNVPVLPPETLEKLHEQSFSSPLDMKPEDRQMLQRLYSKIALGEE